MEVAKSTVLKLVDELPERFELEELQYRLYLRQKLEAAEEDIREGKTVTHDELGDKIASW